MPLDFPSSPIDGQVYDDYVFDATAGVWRAINTSTFPVAISNGGTGASTLAGAQDNLQVGLIPIVPNVTFSGGSVTSTPLGKVTFSAVSSISLNGVFSSAYHNYRIVFSDLQTNNAAGFLTLRFRNGSTDDATNTYYQYWFMSKVNGTSQFNSGGPNTSYSLCNVNNFSSFSGSWTGEIISPALSGRQTVISGIGIGSDSGGVSYQIMSQVLYNTAKAFDGITFFPTIGTTLSGNLQLFGYNE